MPRKKKLPAESEPPIVEIPEVATPEAVPEIKETPSEAKPKQVRKRAPRKTVSVKKKSYSEATPTIEAPAEPLPISGPTSVEEPTDDIEFEPAPQIKKPKRVRGPVPPATVNPLPILRGILCGGLILTIAMLYLFAQFRGFSTVTAMDQAQIARQLAQGQGFSTKFIRPLAIWQLEKSGKPVPSENFPDLFQSPLNPLVNALPLKWIQSSWRLTPIDLIYAGDRMIAGVSIIFFLLSLLVWYFVGKKLFNKTIALTTCAAVLLTDLMWQFSLSGLPQMLMLFLFSGAIWFSCKAIEISTRHRFAHLAGAAFLLGLMTLAHGAAAFIFLGWLVFALISIKPRLAVLPIALLAFVCATAPWMYRNYSVSGTPLGLAAYELIAPADSAESGYMRTLSGPPTLSKAPLLLRIKKSAFHHSENIFAFLGMNIAALMFFVSLIHRFDFARAAHFRWAALLMWAGALVGMLLCGTGDSVSSNQLHVLFIPLFALNGIALLFALWSRFELTTPIWRAAFISSILGLCALPMALTLAAGPGGATQWPPYVPPFIAILGDWYGEKEVICSDMPWAVAWYAQRKALLLPKTIKEFNRISDYRVLGEPVKGLYLTPVTGNRALFADIYTGTFTDWVFLITRPPEVSEFSLPVFTPLPLEGECILFSDRDRWSRRE